MSEIHSDYPLMEHAADELKAVSGRPLSEITLDVVTTGELSARDLEISAETLHAQARIARQAGYPQLAANLTRAAELTALSGDELLAMYKVLRPGRSKFSGGGRKAARLAICSTSSRLTSATWITTSKSRRSSRAAT